MLAILPRTAPRRQGLTACGRATSPVGSFITQRGRAAAIMISPESFERSENEREILKRLARGERDISKGKGFDLDSVFAEADELLARRS